MKHHIHPYRFVPLLLLVVLALAGGTARAQETMHVEQTIDVDELGDGTFKMLMTFTASQFQAWQDRFGDNPALLRRDITLNLSQYDVTGFNLEKNELDREVTITLSASGMTRYKGDGLFELDVPKNWKLANKDKNVLKFTYLEPAGMMTIQHHVTINLPEAASDVTDPHRAEGGMQRMTYTMPVKRDSSLMLILGIVLLVAGLAVTAVGAVKAKG